MGDLLKSQIRESCKLAMPEGLKELMSDISREVLRTQPQDLYQFIADYLGALLQVRDTLTIACQICADTCECACESAMYKELQDIGLSDDVDKAVEIIKKHLETGSVKEQSLFTKLIRNTSLEESQVSAVQDVIQKAFKRYKLETNIEEDLPLTDSLKKLALSAEFKSRAEQHANEVEEAINNDNISLNEDELYNMDELDNDTVGEDIQEEIDDDDSEYSIEEALDILDDDE